MDPNSLDIHQPQAPLVNLITLLAWIPLNFLQPATPACGHLDEQSSIKGAPLAQDARQTLQTYLKGPTWD